VAHYRAYILNCEDRIVKAIDLDCEDDAAASESAKQLVDGHDVELWRNARMVNRLATTNAE
jgi:hypothetical protein